MTTVADTDSQRRAGDRQSLEELFMTAPMPMCILEGPRLTFTFANASYSATFGGRSLVGKAFLDALPELRGQGFDALLVGVMTSGESHIGSETPVQMSADPPGQLRYFNFVCHPQRAPGGESSGVLVFGVDVTAQVDARKQVEAQSELHRQAEQRLRCVVEATGAGMWELDLRTQKVTADARLRELHGFPADGPVDLDLAFASTDLADAAVVRRRIDAALDPNGSGRFEVQYRTTDASGGRRWIEATGCAFFDAAGVPTELIGTALDITPRKQAELAREGLLAALEAQPFLQVCVLEGPQYVVKLVNEEYRVNVAGGRDIVGLPVLDAFPDLASQGFGELMKQVLDTGKPYVGREVATRLKRADGVVEERFFNFVVQPVLGAHGTVDTLLNISHDVTHFVEARRVLESVAVEHKDRADFEQLLIGIVSHDLRNPLSAMHMGVRVLLEQHEIDATHLKVLLRIQSSVERMARLVNDLLDFTQARIGSGLAMVHQPMNLQLVVRQVVEELRMAFPAREILLEAVGDSQGVWDPDRIGQVALNLITNALKYGTQEAPVCVSTRADGDSVELKVFNRGKPISPEILPHLFKPMQRGGPDVDRSSRSVGLGLYIVKHVIDALGGRIAVSSTADAGTTFTISLPRVARVAEENGKVA
ncbi:MAG: PAS domain-containing protein [Deltaproteobacteria bacterium]|nr:PAS domain-containing protein [Nannocystaceae bacterium]